MNYSKKGIRAKQKSLHATSAKLSKKVLLAFLNLSLLFVRGGHSGAQHGIRHL